MPISKAEEEVAPPSPETVLPEGAAYRYDDGAFRVTLSVGTYSLDAIFRSCYWLTDRAYVYLGPVRGDLIEVTLLSKARADATARLVWNFLNDLVDQRLRVSIAKETAAVREMIVAQAFADADVIDDTGAPSTQETQNDQADTDHDPKRIRLWRPAS